MDEFILFYMGVKKFVHQLQEGKSIAVTNDTFIKVFLGKSISYEELHTEAKWFLKEGSATYNVILDKIHADFCAQDNTDIMRDENQH